MTRSRLLVAIAFVLALMLRAPAQSQQVGPVLIVETSRGIFSIEMFPGDAPLTVAHVVALARSGFYDGQRVHRAVPGFVVQFGDPQSREEDRRDVWGRGIAAGSGKPVGVAEIAERRRHVRGAVGMAHMGNPSKADSQLYVTLDSRPDLDGQYAVIGQVTGGEEVPAMLQIGDLITRVTVRP